VHVVGMAKSSPYIPPPYILCLNCGSSSVKYAAFDLHLNLLTKGMTENIAAPTSTHANAIRDILYSEKITMLGKPAIVGHRVVHGGATFSAPCLINPESLAEIKALTKLAPAHQAHNVAGITAIQEHWPDVPQFACFDTAFHATLPPHRWRLPIAQRFADKGLRRYGFHGLSYEHVVEELPRVLGPRATGKIIMCHLGNGCSLAAINNLRCVYTTMGFTPLDGMMMGQRPGRLDPGAVLWLVEELNGDVQAVRKTLNSESGLLGVSGISADMRVLLASPSENANGENAKLAVTMFIDRLAQEIAAAAAALGGVDAITFSGGIGENAAAVREGAMKQLGWLPAHVTNHVIPANEELTIARAAQSFTRK
jgi:acetate kinase